MSSLNVISAGAVIIGAGPAGIAAAIQLKRCGIDPLILEQREVGGLLNSANLVENYPGFPQGISGPALVRRFAKQLKSVGVPVTYEKAIALEFENNEFRTRTDRQVINSPYLVIATGTKPKDLPELSVDDAVKHRVFNEIRPIMELDGRTIAIIGAGDAAFDYALNLSGRNTVMILNRTDRVSCLPLLYERCMSSNNISYLDDVHVTEFNGEGGKVLLRCADLHNKPREIISVDYVLTAVGREPSRGIWGGQLCPPFIDLLKQGKLFLIGDVNNGRCRQTGISVGDGVKAAMQIFNNIRAEQK